MALAAKSADETAGNEITILGRVLGDGKEFTPALARHLLGMGFSAEDDARINDLAARNQKETLSRDATRDPEGETEVAFAGCSPVEFNHETLP